MGRRIVEVSTVGANGRVVRGDSDASRSELGQYWDRLKNLIPAEVSAIYIAGHGVIPQGEKVGLAVWATACLIFTILFMYKETQRVEGKPKAKYPPDWMHITISSISFLLWVYALGGPFSEYGVYVPWIGTLIILAWTFVVPYFYKGKTA